MKSLREQIAGKCINFNGIQNTACNAGVKYDDIKDKDARPLSIPCFEVGINGKPCAVGCEKRRMPTAEEVEARVAEIETHLAESVRKLNEGVCNDCDAKIERAKQVGNCMYAEPCGHRIGQGDAKSYNKRKAS